MDHVSENQAAALGSELETASEKECIEFAKRHHMSRCHLLAKLGDFAILSAAAKLHRKAGRIVEAELYEGYCDSVYNALPEGARW